MNPDRLVAVINLNYMFPIHKSLIKNLEYKDIEKHRTFKTPKEKSQYIDLLTKELAQINKPGEAAEDLEGMQTMRTLARNMSFLMKSIQLGKQTYGLSEKEAPTWTNFIR